MRYAVHFTWNDGFQDSFDAENAKDRDLNIKDMLSRNDFKMISWCPKYVSGEQGAATYVKGSYLD